MAFCLYSFLNVSPSLVGFFCFFVLPAHTSVNSPFIKLSLVNPYVGYSFPAGAPAPRGHTVNASPLKSQTQYPNL